MKLTRLAEMMISRGVNPAIVSASIGISRHSAESLWQKIFGEKFDGQIAQSSHCYLHTWERVLHANIFFQYYEHGCHDVRYTVDPEVVIMAYDSYVRAIVNFSEVPLLDLTAAWFIARDLRSLELDVLGCDLCGINYLHGSLDYLRNCPCQQQYYPTRCH